MHQYAGVDWTAHNPTSLQDVLPSEAVEYIVCILCNSHCKCMWYGMDHIVLLMLHKHFNKETNTHATLLRIGVCIKYTQMYTVNSFLAFCITAIHWNFWIYLISEASVFEMIMTSLLCHSSLYILHNAYSTNIKLNEFEINMPHSGHHYSSHIECFDINWK